jgi:hypothetical protein
MIRGTWKPRPTPAQVGGALARRFAPRAVVNAGLLLTAARLVALALLVSPARDYALLVPCLAAIGVGTGIFMTHRHRDAHGLGSTRPGAASSTGCGRWCRTAAT